MLPKKTFPYRQAAVVAVALAALLPDLACRSVAQTVTSVVAVPQSAPRTRGGVTYDPASPLNAVVTPPKIDPANPPKVSQTYTISFRSANDQTIPGLFVVPTGVKGAPTILLLHGLGGKKEDMLPLAWGLAQKGYASLTIDAAGHGARPRIDGKEATNLDLGELRKMVAQTIADLRHSVDFLVARPEVDAKRMGYLGISMGAIEGTVFVADEPRIKDAVLWAGGGNWGKLITTTALPAVAAYRKTTTGTTQSPADIEKVMADIDPVGAVHAISPRPLLFINGDKDTIVPTACTDELIAAAGEPKTRITLPGGHVPDVMTMALKSLQFFDKNLK